MSEQKFLTQEECDGLCLADEVIVQWAGSKEEHRFEVSGFDDDGHSVINNQFNDSLIGVGDDLYSIRVRLAEDDDEADEADESETGEVIMRIGNATIRGVRIKDMSFQSENSNLPEEYKRMVDEQVQMDADKLRAVIDGQLMRRHARIEFGLTPSWNSEEIKPASPREINERLARMPYTVRRSLEETGRALDEQMERLSGPLPEIYKRRVEFDLSKEGFRPKVLQARCQQPQFGLVSLEMTPGRISLKWEEYDYCERCKTGSRYRSRMEMDKSINDMHRLDWEIFHLVMSRAIDGFEKSPFRKVQRRFSFGDWGKE